MSQGKKDSIELSCKDAGFRGEAEMKRCRWEEDSKARPSGELGAIRVDRGARRMGREVIKEVRQKDGRGEGRLGGVSKNGRTESRRGNKPWRE